MTEYYKPALAWTRRIRKGNLSAIARANVHNIHKFESDYGSVHLIHVHALYPGVLIADEIVKN